MDKVNVGIVGLGGFASLIFSALEKSDRLFVSAGADTDQGRLKEFRDNTGITKTYDDSEGLLKDPGVQIVVIATPPFSHFEIGKAALSAGKHVFFEKPGSLSPEDMGKLISLAEERQRKASIDFVMRRNPLYFILKQLCKNGTFGLAERAFLENYAHDDSLPPEHWFWDYEKSGGIWVEHGVHFFDLTNWLLGPACGASGEKIPRRGADIVDRVVGRAFHDDAVVSYYHGFTKPEALERTYYSLVFERAYTKAKGWIPVELAVDAMTDPDTEEYMTGDLLSKAQKYLPGIDVILEVKHIRNWDKTAAFKGRGKTFEAPSRINFIYRLGRDRWEVYKACVREGIEDLAKAVLGEKRCPEVGLSDAKLALETAHMMEQ